MLLYRNCRKKEEKKKRKDRRRRERERDDRAAALNDVGDFPLKGKSGCGEIGVNW